MNYLELAIWGITGLTLVVGILLGALRGARRATLRLVLVLCCAVGAYFLRGAITDLVLNIQVGDVTVSETLTEFLGSMAQDLGETVIILATVIASVVVFMVAFYLLKFLSWLILFPLLKLVVKKGKKKHGIVGAVIGLVQGAVVALCICVPLSGLITQTNRIMSAVGELQDAFATAAPSDEYYALAEDETDGDSEGDKWNDGDATEGEEGQQPENQPSGGEGAGGGSEGSGESIIPQEYLEMLQKYDESFIGKFYSQTLKTPFTWISTVNVKVVNEETGETEEKTYTLEGQIDAVVGAVRMAKTFAELRNITWDENFDGSVAEQIKAIMDKLAAVNGELSPEARDTINRAANALLNNMGLPVEVDASGFDLNHVDFAKEGELIVDIVEIANKETFTADDLGTIADSLKESTLVMPMLESAADAVPVSKEKQDMIEDAISDYEAQNPDRDESTNEMLETLRNLFGIK